MNQSKALLEKQIGMRFRKFCQIVIQNIKMRVGLCSRTFSLKEIGENSKQTIKEKKIPSVFHLKQLILLTNPMNKVSFESYKILQHNTLKIAIISSA